MRFRSELEFVQWLQHQAPQTPRGVRMGIGDDAALVSATKARDLVLTTDLSLEGVHFRRSLHPPDSIGHRAMARALSDVAAMGGKPRFALISLAVPPGTTTTWLRAFYAAISALAERFGVVLVGGDTAIVADGILIDVILVGEVGSGRALLRSGARPGDRVFVSGRLGLSSLGLEILKSQARSGRKPSGDSEALRAHLYPEPQCALGEFLLRRSLASAAMDISDGLSTDLHRLCEASGVGAYVWENTIPVADGPEAVRFSKAQRIHHALHGGEDYQLLFAVPRAKASRLPRRYRGIELHPIGEITRTKGIYLIRANGKKEILPSAGWDHFQRAQT